MSRKPGARRQAFLQICPLPSGREGEPLIPLCQQRPETQTAARPRLTRPRTNRMIAPTGSRWTNAPIANALTNPTIHKANRKLCQPGVSSRRVAHTLTFDVSSGYLDV